MFYLIQSSPDGKEDTFSFKSCSLWSPLTAARSKNRVKEISDNIKQCIPLVATQKLRYKDKSLDSTSLKLYLPQ